MNDKDTVGVVLVNWNGWRNALRSHESLLRSSHKRWTLFIVDNASTDESVHMIRENLPGAVLIESTVNAGFAGGCNLAIRAIISCGIKYVLLLNNDATVDNDSLSQLVAASQDLQDRAVLGSVVRYCPSGEMQYFGSRKSQRSGRPEWFTMAKDAELLESKLIATDFVFGAALFAPAHIFQAVGLFDERFFLNYEEIDWCYRAAALGFSQYVVSSSVIHHQGSASLGHKYAPLQMYFLFRNRLLFFDKHGSAIVRMRGFLEVVRELAAMVLKRASATTLTRALKDPPVRALALGIRDYVFRRFGDCPQTVRELAVVHSQQVAQHGDAL